MVVGDIGFPLTVATGYNLSGKTVSLYAAPGNYSGAFSPPPSGALVLSPTSTDASGNATYLTAGEFTTAGEWTVWAHISGGGQSITTTPTIIDVYPAPVLSGGQQDVSGAAANSVLNISVPTVVNTGAGWVYTVLVTTPGDAPGAIYDNTSSSSGNTATNLIGYIPNAVGAYTFQGFPFVNGLVFIPGPNQVASVSYTA